MRECNLTTPFQKKEKTSRERRTWTPNETFHFATNPSSSPLSPPDLYIAFLRFIAQVAQAGALAR